MRWSRLGRLHEQGLGFGQIANTLFQTAQCLQKEGVGATVANDGPIGPLLPTEGVGYARPEALLGIDEVPPPLSDPGKAEVGPTIAGIYLDGLLVQLSRLLQPAVAEFALGMVVDPIGIDLEGIAQPPSVAELHRSFAHEGGVVLKVSGRRSAEAVHLVLDHARHDLIDLLAIHGG